MRTPSAPRPSVAAGGLFGTASAYLSFLRGVLSRRIVSEAAYAELFADSLAPDVASQMGAQVAGMLNSEETHPVGHSVGMMLSKADSPHGPKAGSGAWGGLSNTQYWLDPASGLAVSLEVEEKGGMLTPQGICFTQLVSAPPEPFNDVYTKYQELLYKSLGR